MNTSNADNKARALANAFSSIIRDWFSDAPETLAEIVERNKVGSPQNCATHDFCDSNMAMHEAWVTLFGGDGVDALDKEQAALWRRAWDLAVSAEFQPIEHGN